MPPLECANFLECENKTVCVAPFGSLRPSFWIQPQCFSIIYQKIITIHPAEFFFFFFAKMAWNAIVCETTDVSRETSIFPIFQKTWFQAILAKKKRKKRKKTRSTTILWSAKILQSAWIYSMCTSLAVECEEIMECEEFWVCVAGIETTEGNFGARTKIPIPKPAPTSRGTPASGFCFSEFTLGEAPGRNWLIFTQPTLKNVTFDNPVLLRWTNEETPLSKQPSIHPTSTAALERHRG